MGWFSKLPGGGRTKEDLIRILVKKRVTDEAAFASVGLTPEAVDALPHEILICLPEATIVSIVKAWAEGKSQQMREEQIFQLIETFRSTAGQGVPPASPTLSSYVKYRVALEQTGDAPLSEAHIDYCIREAQQFFGPT